MIIARARGRKGRPGLGTTNQRLKTIVGKLLPRNAATWRLVSRRMGAGIALDVGGATD
jgi:hypothetical protein